jgi:hypothetical protein
MKAIFHKDTIEHPVEDNKRLVFILKEPKNDVSIKLIGLPKGCYFVKLDIDTAEFKKRSPYFAPGLEHIHKGCDYVLIDEETCIIILFELKGIKERKKIEATQQLAVSEEFIRYVIALHKLFNVDTKTYKFYYVFLSKINSQTLDRNWYGPEDREVFNKSIRLITPPIDVKAINYQKLIQTQ